MTELLIRLFIKNNTDTSNPKVRASYGALSSLVGVCCNILLFIIKFIMGTLSNSIAVTADAFNNLSDVGSSAVSLIGFRMASKPADSDHPFGHGRIEYISGMIISFLILLVGFDFVKTSIDRIFNPTPVIFSIIVIAALVSSILLKIWLCFFNKKLSKKISSATIAATAADSLSDVLATSITLISILVSPFTSFPVDGVMGIIVAAIILYAGYNAASDTISPLLGQPPEKELVDDISKRLLSYNGIIGMHDLIVHDYGPGRIFASVHAEVPIDASVLDSHEVIDLAEREISEALNVHMLIHMDPIDTSCPETNKLRKLAQEFAEKIDASFTTHDFRIVPGEKATNLIFDICIPAEYRLKDSEIIKKMTDSFKSVDTKYNCVITVDRNLAGR